MAYIITKTNGDALVTVPDTEANTDYGVTFVGRNYSGYGIFLNDNFVALMENFANSTAPVTPLTGQLWFNTTTKNLSVWEGSAWKVLSSITSSESEPGAAGRKIGDFWFDNENYQLKIWTGSTTFDRNITSTTFGNLLSITSTSGILADDIVTHANIALLNDVRVTQILNTSQLRISTNANVTLNDSITFTRGSSWYTIGPNYTRGQRTNGIIPVTLTDTIGIVHTVGLIYVNGSIVGVISNDLEFTPATASAITGFATIKPGIQMRDSGSDQITKTVQNFSVGASGTTVIQLISNADLVQGDRYTSANVSIGAGAIISALYPNNAVAINTTTTVYQNEVIVFQRGADSVRLFNGTSTDSQKLQNKSADLFAQLDLYARFQQDVDVDGNIKIGGNINFIHHNGNLTVRQQVSNGNITFVSNVPGVGSQTQIMQLRGTDGQVTVRSNPTVPLGIATKGYVDDTRDLVDGWISSNVSAITTNYATKTYVDNANAAITAAYLAADVVILNLVNNRAEIVSPTFTGIPRAPTATAGANTTQIATTAFVTAAVSSFSNSLDFTVYAPKASPALTGTPTAPTAAAGTNTTQIATTAFVRSAVNTLDSTLTAEVALRAPLASATLTGTPTAPTATAGTNTTQIATTAFTTSAVATLNATITNQLALKSSIESPTFTGVPAVPTATAGTNTTQIATTAFVQTAIAAGTGAINLLPYAEKASPTFTGIPLAPTAAASVNNTQLATTAFVHSVIPAGIIMLWSGSSASIPTGWTLCNGSNGTPDLRDNFVIGAGTTYAVNATGGSKDLVVPSHTHSASATSTFTGAALAAHSHTFTGAALAAHSHTFTGAAMAAHSHTFTGDALSTSHTHTINDPGHQHTNVLQATSDNQQRRVTLNRAVGASGTDATGSNLGENTDSTSTGITLNAASAGTPAGTNSGTSAGTPSGTNSSTSAGTPAGTNETVSAGTPAGTVGTSVTVASSGVSGTNANLPPYYALCYIMKTYG